MAAGIAVTAVTEWLCISRGWVAYDDVVGCRINEKIIQSGIDFPSAIVSKIKKKAFFCIQVFNMYRKNHPFMNKK